MPDNTVSPPPTVEPVLAAGPPPHATGLLARVRDRIHLALPKGSLRARFAAGAFWSAMGAVISQGLGLVASIVAARLLGRDGFGELGMIQSTVGMLGVFAGLGLGMTAMKHVAELRNSDPARAGRIIGMAAQTAWVSGAVIAGAVALAAPYMAVHTINAPHLMLELRLGCLLLLFNAINGAQNGALSGLEAFKSIAKMNLYRGLFNFPLIIGGVLLWGLPGAVLGSVITAGSGCVIGYLMLRRESRASGIVVSYRRWREEAGVLWRFSMPAFLSSVMFGPVEWLLAAILVNQPDGYAEMGIFTAAKQWFIIILYLPGMVSAITLPILSNLWGENQLVRYRRVLFVNSMLLTGLAAVIAIPIAIASPWVMKMYGSSFSQGWLVLAVTCGYAILYASNIVVGQAIW
ncbi:MAG: oligosaccharide flippase family protein, partial [Planctomycetota bacterium]